MTAFFPYELDKRWNPMFDDGITFGTNHTAGLCIAFVEKIPKVIGLGDHSSLWVSVADPEGLATAIGAYSGPD